MEIPSHILEGCKRHDSKSESDLYRGCHAILMRIGLRYAGGDRQAALANVNTCFLKILQHLPTYKESTPFEAWIRRIMINVCVDEFRKNKRYQALIQSGEAEPYDTEESFYSQNEAEANLNAEDIQKILSELPKETACIFNLFCLDDYTHKEIALSLHITESASKWHVAKAKTLLREKIAAYLQYKTSYLQKNEI